MNIIETANLSRRFGRLEAVHELNLAVPAGSVFALLGANGAGKTTTIRMLMNLLAPEKGSATLLGVDSRHLGPAEYAQIGYVSESMQMPFWMTLDELLEHCRAIYPRWDRELEATLARQFELPRGRRLKHFSRGMLMKAALLAALAYRPRLLVLDEPFSGLDPLVRDELTSGILEAACLSDWTVLISSHDIADVERLCDWVAILDAGRLQFSEPSEQLQARFRRVEIDLHTGGEPSGVLPAEWLHPERSGSRITFVDSAFEPAATEKACRERFPHASVTAHPMDLRSIFTALAKSLRTTHRAA